MKRMVAAGALLLVALTAASVTGCRRVPIDELPGQRETTEERSVAVGDATSADVEIRMAVGGLSVSTEPSSTDLLQGELTYAPVTWKPEVDYSVAGGVGSLVVAQPESVRDVGEQVRRNRWVLRLGGGVPVRVRVKLGVGRSEVDLRGLDMTSVEVITGVGDSVVDLSGPRSRDLQGRVETGVGRVTLRLPKDVGVRVQGRETGVGHTSADGFRAEGDAWVNDAWSGTGPKIDLRLTRGVGDVILELAD